MTYTYRQGRAAGFGLSRTSLGFRSFSVSSRKLKLLEFSNLPKTWVEGVGGRERERDKKKNMRHVRTRAICVLSLNKLLDLILPKKLLIKSVFLSVFQGHLTTVTAYKD